MKIIKTLHQWPLSKVELVEIRNKKYILKTIHKDFINEVYRQKLLRRKCKKIRIPEIYWTKKNKEVSFLMDYIEHKNNKISKKVLCEMIAEFHADTRNIKSKYFEVYNIEAFYKDFKQIKGYLNSELKQKSKKQIIDFFKVVFDSPFSVVHGDWGDDQILGEKGKHYIVDFGKSFYGPSILDYDEPKTKSKELNLKAKLVSLIINLAWLDLCKRKYINYNYKKETSEKVKKISKIESKLK
jgi:hypothetical protein|tara:strand:- start:1591 stop:2310 length:720 start_codon:yes stop_codon:yes gene_type:complete